MQPITAITTQRSPTRAAVPLKSSGSAKNPVAMR